MSSDFGIKITRAGYNTLTTNPDSATNIKKFALVSSISMLKIKASARVSLTYTSTATIPHGLSYKPLFWAFIQRGSILEPLYYEIGNSFAYIDATNLVIQNVDGVTRDFYYYIFYDAI
jgi:hypothetical protein